MSYSKSELQTLHLRWKKTRHCAADDWPFRQPDRKAEIFYFKAFDAKFHDLQHSVVHAAALLNLDKIQTLLMKLLLIALWQFHASASSKTL